MNELLKKLLEGQILSAETKTELEEAFNSQMADIIAETKTATEEAVRLQLAEQWMSTRETLIEAIDSKVTEYMTAEVTELKEDISAFRDLEVEYAGKLEEAKSELATAAKADVAQLIEKLDSFLELRIKEEFTELKESIEDAKKLDFGRRMFEMFADEFQTKFVKEDETHLKLAEAEAKLEAVSAKLTEAAVKQSKLERTMKLEGLLAPLTGHSRGLMETILAGVDTKDLDKTYNKFIGRVLKEAEAPAEKEDKVLAEGAEEVAAEVDTLVVKTGDVIAEASQAPAVETLLSESEKVKLQRLAGIID